MKLVSGKIDFYETSAKEAIRDKQNNAQTILQLKKYIDFILRAQELECEEKGLYDKVVQNTVWHKY